MKSLSSYICEKANLPIHNRVKYDANTPVEDVPYLNLKYHTNKDIENLVGPAGSEDLSKIRSFARRPGDKTFRDIARENGEMLSPEEVLVAYVNGELWYTRDRFRTNSVSPMDKRYIEQLCELATKVNYPELYRVIEIGDFEKARGVTVEPGLEWDEDFIVSTAYDMKGIYEYCGQTRCTDKMGRVLFILNPVGKIEGIDIVKTCRKDPVLRRGVHKFAGQYEVALLPKVHFKIVDMEPQKVKGINSIKYVAHVDISQH